MSRWHDATARWRELTAEAERLDAERDRAFDERRFGDAMDLSTDLQKVYRARLLLTGRQEGRDVSSVRAESEC